MAVLEKSAVCIVDYGLGNIFSIKHACEHAGLNAALTSSRKEIEEADAVILPGVGAFGDAMAALRRLDLVELIRDIASSEKPLIGICLGMQLFMSESEEFGLHKGLGIIDGVVTRLKESKEIIRGREDCKEVRLKVPEVGWNRIQRRKDAVKAGVAAGPDADPWEFTPLKGLREGEFMYFVHSFYVKPDNADVILSVSSYGDIEYCSSLACRQVVGFQYHPERSSLPGLKIYENIASMIKGRRLAKKGNTYV